MLALIQLFETQHIGNNLVQLHGTYDRPELARNFMVGNRNHTYVSLGAVPDQNWSYVNEDVFTRNYQACERTGRVLLWVRGETYAFFPRHAPNIFKHDQPRKPQTRAHPNLVPIVERQRRPHLPPLLRIQSKTL